MVLHFAYSEQVASRSSCCCEGRHLGWVRHSECGSIDLVGLVDEQTVAGSEQRRLEKRFHLGPVIKCIVSQPAARLPHPQPAPCIRPHGSCRPLPAAWLLPGACSRRLAARPPACEPSLVFVYITILYMIHTYIVCVYTIYDIDISYNIQRLIHCWSFSSRAVSPRRRMLCCHLRPKSA